MAYQTTTLDRTTLTPAASALVDALLSAGMPEDSPFVRLIVADVRNHTTTPKIRLSGRIGGWQD